MSAAKTNREQGRGHLTTLRQGADKWLFLLISASLLVWFLLILLAGMPGPLNLVAIPLAVLGGPTAAIILLIVSAKLFLARKPRAAVSVALIAIFPPLLWNQFFWATECVHIPLTTVFGIGQIGTPSFEKNGRFATYDWSVGLVTNPATFLVYDAADRISLPLPQHRYSLMSEGGLYEECAGRVTHLIGHFYECSF